MFDSADPALLAKFKEFHAANPKVMEKFLAYARLIRQRGFKKYSAWTIVNVIRWEEDLATSGDVFTINNDFIAIYARLVIHNYPDEFTGFFELRSMKPRARKKSHEEYKRLREEKLWPAKASTNPN